MARKSIIYRIVHRRGSTPAGPAPPQQRRRGSFAAAAAFLPRYRPGSDAPYQSGSGSGRDYQSPPASYGRDPMHHSEFSSRDTYTSIQSLGSGGQGSTSLVLSHRTGKVLVLKKLFSSSRHTPMSTAS
jgi:hypothetical protein